MRVLIAADGSEPCLRACRLAAGLLPAGSQVRVLTVLSFDLYPHTMAGEDLSDTPERIALVQEAVLQATGEAARILHEAGHSVAPVHRFGNPADEIVQDILDHRPDLVVVGRRGLSGPSRWLIGRVSERVVRHSNSPVLVVA